MEKLFPGCDAPCEGYKTAMQLVEKAAQRVSADASLSKVSDEAVTLHQRLTKAAIAYTGLLQSCGDYELVMAAVQELEDAADAWATRGRLNTAQEPEAQTQTASLTFTDNLDGTLGISMKFEPDISDETRSGAVRCAISCMDYIVARLDRG